jgi:hypothetical protein
MARPSHPIGGLLAHAGVGFVAQERATKPGAEGAVGDMARRTTTEVFEEHLRLRLGEKLDDDLQRNDADDVVGLCEYGAFRGRDAIRESARRLAQQLPHATFVFRARQVAGEYALLLWRATSDTHTVCDGADSSVIRDGRIILQTIFYRLGDENTSAGPSEFVDA